MRRVPPFPEPTFPYDYDLQTEVAAARKWRDEKRKVPPRAQDRLLIATWNISNLGHPGQQRSDKDIRLIAELASWFDLVTFQEVNDNLSGLRALESRLSGSHQVLVSDAAGNDERLAFVFDPDKVEFRGKVGEIAIPPSESRYIELPGIEQEFRGFDRNPYLAAFKAGDLEFLLVSVHLYFGSEKGESSKRDMNRRSLETYAVARWADLRRRSANAFTRNIIALGDFNMPKADPGDPIYEALTRRGLQLPDHSSEMGSSIKKDRHYDQLAFFPPGQSQRALVKASEVFDFDGALFRSLWDDPGRAEDDYFEYVRYHISDHRLLWAELALQ
jgi:endonuclease/exonuclease/phosphatase family metal-dependent hydrolase